jgi:hypothetical protein
MVSFKYFMLSFLILSCIACNPTQVPLKTIVITNALPFERSNETVTIDLQGIASQSEKAFSIVQAGSETPLLSQIVDIDEDGVPDQLLFQPSIAGESSETFELLESSADSSSTQDLTCFSRFVPERTDDYAWENDKVAFRTFGPEAQRMKEAGIKGGTLTSGIDGWLKRVDYPIIDKWYHKETSDLGSYHEDTGEGLDNFHVGVSRGIGGSAVPIGGNYVVSKNFVTWKTHSVGPIRTSFTLTYENWSAGDKTVEESKTISLDRGSHLSHIQHNIQGVDTIAIGLTLHENDGEATVNMDQEWLSYWQPHGDSDIGMAVVICDGAMVDSDKYITDAKDESHLYAWVKVNGNEASYYSGFGWRKSGQFNSSEEWNNYIQQFAQQLETPLTIEVQ